MAVGDALGLACENLTPATIARRFAPVDRYRLPGGVGFVSDDTEQTAMVAEALLANRGDPAGVARSLAWKLRLWVLLLPAGIGMATLRACAKLLLGVPPRWSGVRSAGNGAAMRSVPIGLWAPEEPQARDALVSATARVTHTHPHAIEGAALVAHATALLLHRAPDTVGAAFLDEVAALARPSGELAARVARARSLLESGTAVLDAARELGTTGWVVHTVPFALFCLVRGARAGFATTVREAVEAGGDADTIAAIVGGMAGALHGAKAIPSGWIERLEQRGRGRRHLEALARAFETRSGGAPRAALFYRIVRAPFFVALILTEALRRFVDAPRAIARGEWRST